MELLLAFALAASAAPAPPAASSASLASPAARQLLERDWVLLHWALKAHDGNRDRLIDPAEAQAAAAEFRSIADADGDGRVTQLEYRAARAFILARY